MACGECCEGLSSAGVRRSVVEVRKGRIILTSSLYKLVKFLHYRTAMAHFWRYRSLVYELPISLLALLIRRKVEGLRSRSATSAKENQRKSFASECRHLTWSGDPV